MEYVFIRRVVRASIFVALLIAAAAACAQNKCEQLVKYRKYHPDLWRKYWAYASCFPNEPTGALRGNEESGCNFFVARVLTEAGVLGLKYFKNDPRFSGTPLVGAY